jgi:hypothetical protein
MEEFKNDYAENAIDQINFLERLKINNARDIELAKEKTKQAKITAKEKRSLRRHQQLQDPFTRMVIGWVAATGLIMGSIAGLNGIFNWTADSPAKSPEQMKQQRWDQCMKDTDLGGQPTQVWFPEEQGGQGLCLPKGQNPPGK